MNSRKRFQAVMSYQPVDHGILPFPWFSFPETLERWKNENYTEADLQVYPFDQWLWEGVWYFPEPPFEREVIEEDDRHVLYVNHEGIVMREMKGDPWGSMPQFVRFPVETREDFRQFAKERLQPDVGPRIARNWGWGAESKRIENWVDHLKTLRSQPAAFIVIADRWGGFFGPLRNLMGVENLCMTFYTDPAFIEEMMDYIADYVMTMTGQILDHVEIDMFGFWEDMAYNNGPLISPDLVREYMLPRYKRVVEYLRGRGVKWICLDSDGQIDELIPIWLEAGIDLLYPFEAAAGMDVVETRRKFGKDLRMFGGVDKRVLARSREAIDDEIERVRPLIEEGGYIAAPDHSIPPDVPYANFCYYLENMSKALGITS